MIPAVAANDTKRVKSIFQYSKSVFRWIIVALAIVAIAAMTILNLVVREEDRIEHMFLYYLLFAFSSLLTYASASQSAVFSAYQKVRVVELGALIGYVVSTILQIAFLILYPSFLVYICLMILGNFISVCYVKMCFRRDFKEIDGVSSEISIQDKKVLFNRVRDVFMTRLSGIAVESTDNMLISRLAGLELTGLYNNYSMVFSNVRSLAKNAYTSMESGLGSLNTVLKKKELLTLYKRELFGFHCIGTVLIACTVSLVQEFMGIWLGNESLLPMKVVIIVCIDLYINILLYALTCCYNTTSLYCYTKYIFFVGAIINIIASIILGVRYHLLGILIGTLLSRVICIFPALIILVYKKILEKKVFYGFVINIVYMLQAFVIIYMVFKVSLLINVNSLLLWGVKACFLLGLSIVLLLLLNCKNKDLHYFFSRFLNLT